MIDEDGAELSNYQYGIDINTIWNKKTNTSVFNKRFS